MAVEDALLVIAESWADIEPLMPVGALRALADLAGVADQAGAWTDNAASAQRWLAVFSIVAGVLPPDHPAWSAYELPRMRYIPNLGEVPAIPADLDLVRRAIRALDDPLIAADARADALARACLSDLLAFGTVAAEDQGLGNDDLLVLAQGSRRYYPLFQFASVSPYRQHEIVAELGPRLAADTDPAGAVSWWLTPNPWLSARPADLLGSSREAEIRFAADQLANDSW